MDPAELEQLVDGALKALPAPRAPRTLLPRVMAAAGAARPGRRHAPTWFAWPAEWKAASIAALVLLVAAALWLLPTAQATVTAALLDPLYNASGRLAALAKPITDAAAVGRVVWDSFLGQLVWYLCLFVVVMSAACAAFGAALGRVALGGASEL